MKVTGVDEVRNNLSTYAKIVSDRRERSTVLAAGAQKVRQEAAKAPTPKSKRVHYYYSKAGRIAIKPGNLRRSMKVFRQRDGDVAIGPRVLLRVVGMSEIGATAKTASGFYAAALYGSASNFRMAIMEPALSRAQTAALAAIQKRYEKLHQKLTR